MKRKTALITGGTRGIGLGIARALAHEGYDLALNGVRGDEQVKEVIEELKTTGVEVIYCRGNIASGADRAEILDKVYGRFGHLNVLVNNAGVAPRRRKDILEVAEEDFEAVLKVNLTGGFFLTQAVARQMIGRKNEDPSFAACIINVSSVSATLVSVNRGEYCISKAGVSMSTQLFAVRLGEYDIHVYEVRPGITATDMTAGVKEKYDKLIEEGLLVQKRWGMPEDTGKAVAALVRGDFSYSTGQVIMTDGGLTIPRL
jgi:NAD(P)-dependent dehydrogenase (short-subunit alcohol dehydrogenase family)